jgi:MFS transporter, putative metabolite:H+ symporter
MKRGDFPKALVMTVALGYAVDLLDTFLTLALRQPSLRDLGVPSSASLVVGNYVFGAQLLAQMIGALLIWGPLADLAGRRKVLFASILVYGSASIATGYANSLHAFEMLRVVAGIGLGGELGAGIVLISETMKTSVRGRGAMIVGFCGMLGVVAAGLLAQSPATWRTDYKIGGVLALILLFLRLGFNESAIFESTIKAQRASYFQILRHVFWNGHRLWKFLKCVLVGAPTFFVIGLFVSGAPEFGAAVGLTSRLSAASALVWTYSSIAIGDILCGQLAQVLRSRRWAIIIFHVIGIIGFSLLLFVPETTAKGYYWRCALIGIGVGFWANMALNAAEQWGADVRGTVGVTVPNAVRCLLVPIQFVFGILRPHIGYVHAAGIIGFACYASAIWATCRLDDGFNRNLNFTEITHPRSAVITGSQICE